MAKQSQISGGYVNVNYSALDNLLISVAKKEITALERRVYFCALYIETTTEPQISIDKIASRIGLTYKRSEIVDAVKTLQRFGLLSKKLTAITKPGGRLYKIPRRALRYMYRSASRAETQTLIHIYQYARNGSARLMQRILARTANLSRRSIHVAVSRLKKIGILSRAIAGNANRWLIQRFGTLYKIAHEIAVGKKSSRRFISKNTLPAKIYAYTYKAKERRDIGVSDYLIDKKGRTWEVWEGKRYLWARLWDQKDWPWRATRPIKVCADREIDEYKDWLATQNPSFN